MGVVVAFTDISERNALDRMKDEFVSTVSHELRTPLTSIRGALGLLSASGFAPDGRFPVTTAALFCAGALLVAICPKECSAGRELSRPPSWVPPADEQSRI